MMTNPNQQPTRQWTPFQLARRWLETPLHTRHGILNQLGIETAYRMLNTDGGNAYVLGKIKDAGKLDALWELIKPTT